MGPRDVVMVLFGTVFLSVSSMPVEKDERSLSLFSVVQFPNEPCTSTEDASIAGTCLSSMECSERDGNVQGNCASGFGVCCIFLKTGCTDVGTITRNCTYIQSPGFPAAFTTADQTCEYKVRGAGDICQIRLDFKRLELPITATTGVCVGALTTKSQAGKQHTICGNNNGEHLYYETEMSTGASTFTITTGTGDTKRFWKIKVSMIDCNSNSRAPRDCAQYFTGVSGIFQSPNFAGGLVPVNQRLPQCFRQEAGFCQISYSVDAGTMMPAPFTLQTNPGVTAAERIACTAARLNVPFTSSTDYYCGTRLNELQGNLANGLVTQRRTPFMVILETIAAPSVLGSVGYRLMYNQVPC